MDTAYVRIMKLLEKFVMVVRQLPPADNTIDVYRSWIRQFIRFQCHCPRALQTGGQI
jgi:hypothetical protein